MYVNHVIQTIEYEGAENTAAVLMETIPGSNGMVLIPPEGFLKRIKDYCKSKGILFIADEVMTGFGRTGKMFAVEHFDIVPDIMTCAKGITNGAVPMGAVFVSDEVASFFDDEVLYVGLTYSAHPLACAAGIATLEAFEEENVLENCQTRGEELKAHLSKLREAHPSVGDVRSIGLLGVIELVEDKETRTPITDAKVLNEMKKAFEDRHLYLFCRWHYIIIVPPLVIDSNTLSEGMKIIEEVVSEIADAHVAK